METEQKKLIDKLREPFRKDDLKWRIQAAGKTDNGIWAMALVYITSRAIQERLDEAVGIENWKNEFRNIENGSMCGISIRINDEWITKWDGAGNTDIESIKGGISNSMKRAAVQWGIGRYLYSLKERFVDCVMDNKFKNKTGWEKGKTPKKQGEITFYWQVPEIELWAMHEDDNVFINLELQKMLRGYIIDSGASTADFRKQFNVQEASMITKKEYNSCVDWIKKNATKEASAKPVRLAEE